MNEQRRTVTRRPGTPPKLSAPKSSVPGSKSAGSPSSTSASGTKVNTLSIWAMVLSVLGCVSPVGLVLGYRARAQIRRTREYGETFATVAIVVGWAYILALVVGLLAYLFLLVFR